MISYANKKWISRLCLLIAFSSQLLNVSCWWFVDRELPVLVEIEPEWSLSVSAEGAQKYLVLGDIAVRRESYREGLIAFNLGTGEVVWRVQDVIRSRPSPVLVGGNVAVLSRYGAQVVLFNKDTGAVEKKIYLSLEGNLIHDEGELNPYLPEDVHITSYESSLFWGTYKSETSTGDALGLVTVDLSALTPRSGYPGEFFATLEVLHEADASLEERFSTAPYIEDGIIYFGSLPFDDHIYWEPRYRALDLDTGTLLWEIEPVACSGLGIMQMQPYKDKLFIHDYRGFGLMNKEDGSFVWERRPGSGEYAGGFLSGNKFYSTNKSTKGSAIDRNTVQCINVDTGKELWGFESDEESLGSRPVLYDGYLFVAAQTDLKVFDAEDGTLLAYSEDVYGGINQFNVNFLYKDRYMIIEGDNKVFSVDLKKFVEEFPRWMK
jgi:outer membrane protein assembly factor BamB